jgi:Domain of unknown function (DUF4386)
MESRKGISERNAATIIGTLYILGTLSGVLSLAATHSILGASDYFDRIATHRSQMAVGALLELTMGFALAMVPVVFYPIGKRYSERLARGYLVFRSGIEAFLYVMFAFGWLLLIALSKEPAAEARLTARYVKLGGSVLFEQMIALPFVIGALMFYSLLYTARLVPRWLSEWGLVGAVLYIVAPLLRIFGRSFDVLLGPLAIQEMVMAVWLIVKGFEHPLNLGGEVGRGRAASDVDRGAEADAIGEVDAFDAKHS